MRYFLQLFFLLLSGSVAAQLINEFQPNPPDADPPNVDLEIRGTPSTSFSGYLFSVESDNIGDLGLIDRKAIVSGTFDASGLLLVTVPDVENPSFTLVLTADDATATVGNDIDSDNDGVADNVAGLGTVLDAIGIPDEVGDEALLYGTDLGGADFAFTGAEPQLIFRDGVDQTWFAVNVLDLDTELFTINATTIAFIDFDLSPGTPTFGATNPSLTTAPVDLYGFKVASKARTAVLSWATASESGSKAFIIERSTNGGRSFQELGRVNAAGTSHTTITYQFTDEQPISGEQFYRLRQIDLDGQFAIYGPLRFKREGSIKETVIYPNPVINQLSVQNLPSDTEQLVIVNAIGRRVLSLNKADLKSAAVQLDLANLPRGLYLLSIKKSSGEYRTIRFLKQ
jgi:hypothetical protein